MHPKKLMIASAGLVVANAASAPLVPPVEALAWLREPAHASLVGGLLLLVLLLLTGHADGRRRHELAILLVPAAAGIVVLGGLAAVAFRHAPSHPVAQTGAYVQRGAYDYAARAQQGIVYPRPSVTLGQPLFTSLVRRVRFSFAYRFDSALPHRVQGTLSLGLALRSSQGWTRALPGPPVLRFHGTPARVTQTVDLDEVQRTLTRYLDETTLRSDTFTLELVPQVRVRGEVGGAAVDDAFAPTPLSFGVGDHVLRVLSTGTPGSGPDANPLRPSRVGTIETSVPSRLSLVVAEPTVLLVRRVALVGGLAAALLLALALAVRSGFRADEVTRIRQRYGRLLVAVTSAPLPGAGYVDVMSFDGLAQIAASREAVILQHAGGFYVEADGAAYRYRLAAGPRA